MQPIQEKADRISRRQAELLDEVLTGLVPQVLEQGRPADRLLVRFFRGRRELGSRDRRFLSDAVFSYFRWLGWTRKPGLATRNSAALGWLLDQAGLHPALASSVEAQWKPLGGKTLREKRDALAAWFPGDAPPEMADLAGPDVLNSVQLPAGCENRFYETLQQRPPTWLRLRSAAFRKTLSDSGIAFSEHPAVRGAVAVAGGASLGPLGGEGQYQVQDIASQAVALVAAPAAGSSWWDACSGAGGKALHLADLAGPSGTVLASDVRAEALQECIQRARAAGVSSIRTKLHDLAQSPPPAERFDGVLADAPCSGWGTWSRNPDARWRIRPGEPARKRDVQANMLGRAAACLKPGGVLVYAVCTFTREETAEVVERFLAEHPECRLEPFANPLTGLPADGTLQIWPWDGPGDGMFIARFRKHGSES